VGPWGAVSVSKRDQKNRLADKLVTAGVMVDGVLQPLSDSSGEVDTEALRRGFQHLFKRYGRTTIDPWLTQAMRDSLDRSLRPGLRRYGSSWQQANLIMQKLGFSGYEGTFSRDFVPLHLVTAGGRHEAASAQGFDLVLPVDLNRDQSASFTWSGGSGRVSMKEEGTALTIEMDGFKNERIGLLETLAPLITAESSYPDRTMATVREMTFDFQGTNLKARLLLHEVRLDKQDGGILIVHLRGLLLLDGVIP